MKEIGNLLSVIDSIVWGPVAPVLWYGCGFPLFLGLPQNSVNVCWRSQLLLPQPTIRCGRAIST